MNKINQTGFSAVVILLVLLLLTAVSITGYFVYSAQNKETSKVTVAPESSKDSTAPAVAPESSKDSTAPATQQDTQKYLVIKEWGVKIPLTDEIRDAYYVYEKNEGGDGVFLSTRAIAAKYSDCGAENTSLFSYGRFTNPNKYDELTGKKLSELYPNAPKIAGYYYEGTPPQAGCAFSDNEEKDKVYLSSTIIPTMEAFKGALQKIQAQ